MSLFQALVPGRIARLTAAALALAAAGCVEKNDDGGLPTIGGTATARLRVVHAIPDAPALQVRLDDSAAVVTGLTFRQATPTYLSVAGGDHRIRIATAGATTPLVDVTETLAAGTATTVIATGLVGTATTRAIVVADTLTPPASGQVRLRVVHAAPSVSLVDVYLSAVDAALPATPTITALAYRSVANSLAVPAGTYRVRLTPSGQRTVSADVTTSTLAAGTVAKLIAMDPVTTDGAPSVALVTDRVP
jgi:hypothetical protein